MQNTAIDLQSRPSLSAHVRLRADPVDGGPVLLYPEGLLKLNATAHEVLSRCDGTRTVAGIIAVLCEEYDASEELLRADVLACLAQVAQRQLIVFEA
jgi:pyrroloquinoline quinone biosynthesis protein D